MPGVREFLANVTNNESICEKHSQLQPCGLYYTHQNPILSIVVAKKPKNTQQLEGS